MMLEQLNPDANIQNKPPKTYPKTPTTSFYILFTPKKKLLKRDQRSKCKTCKYKASRRKHSRSDFAQGRDFLHITPKAWCTRGSKNWFHQSQLIKRNIAKLRNSAIGRQCWRIERQVKRGKASWEMLVKVHKFQLGGNQLKRSVVQPSDSSNNNVLHSWKLLRE